MVAVFSIFGTISIIMLKQFGVGLAIAVLLDATIVRAVLLPSAMKLLGDTNWYLPRWLEWLPASSTRAPPTTAPSTGRGRRTHRPSLPSQSPPAPGGAASTRRRVGAAPLFAFPTAGRGSGSAWTITSVFVGRVSAT